MAKIIKIMQGTASFTKEQEFPDEATAQVGEKPTNEKVEVTNIKVFEKFKLSIFPEIKSIVLQLYQLSRTLVIYNYIL